MRVFLLGGVLVGALCLFLFGLVAGAHRLPPYHQLAALNDLLFVRHQPDEPVPMELSGDRADARTSLFREFAPDIDVVMVGDSITEGAIWAEIFPSVRVANRGVWGNTTGDVLDRLDSIGALSPNKAFIMLGVNDIAHDVGVSEILDNYLKIIANLETIGAEVVIQSTLLCSAPSCTAWQDNIKKLNAGLEDLAARRGLVFLDLNASMADPETGLHPEFTYDGVHLSGKGYAHWAGLLASHVP